MIKNSDYEKFLFHQGTNYNSYKWLGCHIKKIKDGYKYTFRVWAPNAEKIYLIGDFNFWNECYQMYRLVDSGVWEYVFNSEYYLVGDKYKYKIYSQGQVFEKQDPYAFYSETRGKTASIIHDLKFKWNDKKWIENRSIPFDDSSKHFYHKPLNVYEMHLGSWRTRDGYSNVDGNHYLSYREIADQLVPYLKEMNYTHVEFMPITEYPFDGSWGYQVTGYFSPTSRYGRPEDFAYLVNELHKANIGVIMDWVPAHFPKDSFGLYEYDGTKLYEYSNPKRMEQKSWGTRIFDVGKNEVQSFLISSALFWLREYHIDGLRVDAVASMLYLDYDRKDGEWEPNEYGDNKNLQSIAFFQKLNTQIFSEFPYALVIAEESTAWPKVTAPIYDGGLGFNFKWNMGWAHDIYEYISIDPIYRKYDHFKLTFPLEYAYSEHYILPLSHDEVVHLKKSLLNKMFGSYNDKFACMRVFMTYMMTMPGKKMHFMGTELAQFGEWDYKNQLNWDTLQYPRHSEMRNYIKLLNEIYLNTKELYEIDDSWDGFEWIIPNDNNRNIISYKRKSSEGYESIVLLNFSPTYYSNYIIDVSRNGKYNIIVNSDEYRFGGYGYDIKSIDVSDNKLIINVPSYGAYIIQYNN